MNMMTLMTPKFRRASGFFLAVFLFACAGAPAGEWDELDAAVREVTRKNTGSIEAVAAALDGLAETDWEKTRAVWTWMTHNIAYDTQSYFSGRYGSTDPASVFRSGHSVCDGYAGLFAEIAGRLGLETVKVTGYGKGYGYRNGQADPGGTNHAWNAVKIDGEWHLFDSTWGAGHVSGRRFVWRYSEFYFDTPPEEFVFTHFPSNPDFQVLAEPLDREFFFRLPRMIGTAFNAGVDAAAYMAAVAEGRDVGIPTFYDSDIPVKLVEFPLLGSLKAGETYTIVFETESRWVMVGYGGGRTATYTRGADGRFVITESWPRGSVTFYQAPLEATSEYSHRFTGFMEYPVR